MGKRSLYFLGLMVMLMAFLLGGCGTTASTIMDTYSFGTQQFTKPGSTLTLTLPFEIGKANSATQATDMTYGGSDSHINIIVIGETPKDNKPLASLDAIVDNAVNNVKSVADVTNVRSEAIPVVVDGIEGRKITLAYTEKNTPLSVLQYVFVSQGVLWNIIYQYRTNDAEGAELVKYLDGKIQITQQKVGA